MNPQTALQAAVRNAFSNMSAAWSLLTPAQRTAWSTYALNTPRTDVLGNTIVLPGKEQFVANNTPRIQGGLTSVSAGPTTFGLPDLTAPVLTITAGDPISVEFSETDQWATEVGGALLLYVSDPKAPTVNFCKGPYKYAGNILGAATSPSSPQTIATPNVFTAGQKVFYRVVALTADGRVSAQSTGSVFCGA